jgi:hypothetical protein
MHLRSVSTAVLAATVLGLLAATPRIAAPAHPNPRATAVPCSGTMGFIGVTDANVASTQTSAVLGGDSNYACGTFSAIGAGNDNAISGADVNTIESSFIASGYENSISQGQAFIGSGQQNVVTGSESIIVGGNRNSVSGEQAFIGGGASNVITGSGISAISGGQANSITTMNGSTAETSGGVAATIGGGFLNKISPLGASGALAGTIAGGYQNTLNGEFAVVSGGESNKSSGYLSTIPGGYRNFASGKVSFAGGYESNAVTDGSFVWSDFSANVAHVSSTKPNQFLVRATGGVTFYSNTAQTTGVTLLPGTSAWTSGSDRNFKTGIVPLDPVAILAKVAELPVSEWSWVSERGVRHVGPMAQDFYAAFHVGEDDRHIMSIDEDGVALAAVKGLHAENTALARSNAKLAASNARLVADNASLHRQFTRIQAELNALARTIAAARRLHVRRERAAP